MLRSRQRRPGPPLLGVLVTTGALLTALPLTASAHPEACAHGHTEEQPDHAHDGELCLSPEEDGQGTASLAPGEVAMTKNMKLMATLPKSGPFEAEPAFMSDIAFQGSYAYQGNYEGFQVVDIREPDAPRVVSQVDCAGSQNDISVYGNLLITSTDSSRAFAECYRDGVRNFPRSATAPSDQTWEGIRVFDISDPSAPVYVTAVETDCGSHTHTLVPDPLAGRLLVYVSSYRPAANTPDCLPPHDKISVVQVPLAAPQLAAVVAEPVLFPDGGFPGTPQTSATSGCHDITVYPAKGIAAGACMGEGVILDIRDPLQPRVISSMRDPNFAFWHSATISHDGDTAIFTDELGGGGGPTCNDGIGPVRGANAFYDISDPAHPRFLSYFKIPREQGSTENCVAHNGNLVPGKDVFVQAWYQGGVSVVDFSDPTHPREIGWFDRGPIAADRLVLGGSWSAYWYRGRIYSSDIQRGLDVLDFHDPAVAGSSRTRPVRINAQTQE